MVTAYVMLTCEVGKEKPIIEELKRLDVVKEANGTMGSYDILAKLESSTREDIRNTITRKIRKIENVRSTLTLMETNGQGEM